MDDYTFFKVFSSVAETVQIHLFRSYGGKLEQKILLNRYENGIWGIRVEKNLTHWLYGYRLTYADLNPKQIVISNELIADPWSKHVVTRNHYLQFPLSLIIPEDKFNWQDHDFTPPNDTRDLIIYETHLKDITASPSSWSFSKGSYKSFTDPTAIGGMNHLKKLGINTIEFLPLQKFASIEPSFLEATTEGAVNTWNYYGRNYWGYMTSFYFCPETTYASNASSALYDIVGKDLTARHELKQMINDLHKEGFTVVLDVVYNHVSNYDLNPLKFLDKTHYFRVDQNLNFISNSGCGNDFKTESVHGREIVLQSLKYWIDEFHIDGFRFDLASLIDWETIDSIKSELNKIKPNIILIAEPWSPVNYQPFEFGSKGWSVWNDKFRNGIKGVEPIHRLGFIFGHLNDTSNRDSINNYLNGTLRYRANGLFPTTAQSVNYLESHDGYTLGDFIRLSVNPDRLGKPVRNKKEFVKLGPVELAISKFAATILMLSQGIPMLHAGQEFARSKIIAQSPVNDPKSGYLDHDSYNKDNDTNYLHFNELNQNNDLFEFYSKLIQLRKKHEVFRRAIPEHYTFHYHHDPHVVGCDINYSINSKKITYRLWLNGNSHSAHNFHFEKNWYVLVNQESVYLENNPVITGDYLLPPSSAIVIVNSNDF